MSTFVSRANDAVSRLDDVLRAQALATSTNDEADTAYEVELRLGMCVVGAGARDAHQLRVDEFRRAPHSFEAHVEEMRWRATFAELAKRSDIVALGERERTTHERHGSLRREVIGVDDNNSAKWVEKTLMLSLCTDIALERARPWCDVRIALSCERGNVAEPLDYRTNRGATQIRIRERRSLVVRQAPDWRVDFTIVDLLDSVRGQQYRSFEIEIEHIINDNKVIINDYRAAARTGMTILDMVIRACGVSDRAYQSLVDARAHEHELETLSLS